MTKRYLWEMKGGWFVGDFDPVVLKNQGAEVAVKHYAAYESEPRHHHKIATEITLVVIGSIKMNDHYLMEGEMMVVEPGESVKFDALMHGATTVVVKMPSVANDKYLDEEAA